MRWFREFRNPSLRCERVGHKPVIEWRRGLLPPKVTGFFGGVADRVRQERHVCARCGAELKAWETTQRRSIDSLSGPSDMFEAIRNGGYWLEDGRAALEDGSR